VETQIGTLLSESADAKNMREYRTGLRERQVPLKIGRDIATANCAARKGKAVEWATLHSLDEFNRYESTPLRCIFDPNPLLNSLLLIARKWGHYEQT
jgi:hypothetical protein